MDRAIRLLEGIDDPANAWGEVLGQDLPPNVQGLLLAAASEVLTNSELLRLRARMAGPLASETASPAQKARATAVARDVLAKVDLDDESTLWVCHVLTFIDGTSSPDLRRQVLDCVGHAAHRSRDSGLLLLAAAMWFDFEIARP